jgi:hypothetical protein
VLVLTAFLLVVRTEQQRPSSSQIQKSLDTLLALDDGDVDSLLAKYAAKSGHFDMIAQARVLRDRRTLSTNETGCRAVVVNQTAVEEDALVVDVSASALDIDYIETMLGITAGPLILLYGTDLKAFLVLLNAMYAVDFFGFLRDLQKVNCMMELDQQSPGIGFKVLFGVSTIASVGLKGGAVELILNVGIVSAKLSLTGYELLSRVDLDEYWSGVIYGGMSSFVSGLACTLSAGPVPYGLAAGALTFISTGALAGEVSKSEDKIEEFDLRCAPRILKVKGPDGTYIEVEEKFDVCQNDPTSKDGAGAGFEQCLMVSWGQMFMRIIPVALAVTLALIAKVLPFKWCMQLLQCQCLRWLPCYCCQKKPPHVTHTMLDITVAAIMGASLLTNALK